MLIKFCGLIRQADIDAVIKANADFCGFIFHKKSPRYIEPMHAACLETGSLFRTGVFVTKNPEEIITISNTAKLDYIQLHGDQSMEIANIVGAEKIIRVLWPQRYSSQKELLDAALTYSPFCSYFLLDAGMESGGSGKRINWEWIANTKLPRPWFLAGGLDAKNIKEALSICHPSGVDINSGVEVSPGIKNHWEIKNIINHIYNRNLK